MRQSGRALDVKASVSTHDEEKVRQEKIGLPFPGRQRSWAGYAASSAPYQPSNTIRATQPAYLKWFDLRILYSSANDLQIGTQMFPAGNPY